MTKEPEQLSTKGIWILIGVLLLIAIIVGFVRSQEKQNTSKITETKKVEVKTSTKTELPKPTTADLPLDTVQEETTTPQTTTSTSASDELTDIEKDLTSTLPTTTQ